MCEVNCFHIDRASKIGSKVREYSRCTTPTSYMGNVITRSQGGNKLCLGIAKGGGGVRWDSYRQTADTLFRIKDKKISHSSGQEKCHQSFVGSLLAHREVGSKGDLERERQRNCWASRQFRALTTPRATGETQEPSRWTRRRRVREFEPSSRTSSRAR